MTTPISLSINDIKRQNEGLAADLSAALDRVLARGWYILGPEVEAFENEFAAYCGVTKCVSLANGTDALELALKALKLEPGSLVATVANAGMYATAALFQAGASPLYVEVAEDTMTMDPSALRAVLDHRPVAIIATHLYGRMARIAEIKAIADAAAIPLIEDCAQAHGAQVDGRKAGSWGDIGCFSFYPTKNLGALGDGGAIVTNNTAFAGAVGRLRQYGWREKYRSQEFGGRNSRLDEMQAALLRVKLPHLDRWNQRRRQIAARYSTAFRELPLAAPQVLDASYVAHLYVLRTPARSILRDTLKSMEIATDVHYPAPDYAQPSISPRLPHVPHLPVTEGCCDTVVTLPCFPEMTDAEVDRVIVGVHRAQGLR